ncbi:MAG: cobalamin biosynthesis protein, partial [Paracoccaceae bacterium]
FLLCWASGNFWLRGWKGITKAAKMHRSPNAGWPEAAMARALDIALSGPRSYDGSLQEYAWVNKGGNKHANAHDIDRATRMLWSAWALCLLLILVFSLI